MYSLTTITDQHLANRKVCEFNLLRTGKKVTTAAISRELAQHNKRVSRQVKLAKISGKTVIFPDLTLNSLQKDGVEVAFAITSFEPCKSGHTPEFLIRVIMTHQEHREQGHCGELINRISDMHGAYNVGFEIERGLWDWARDFYSKWGFTKIVCGKFQNNGVLIHQSRADYLSSRDDVCTDPRQIDFEMTKTLPKF